MNKLSIVLASIVGVIVFLFVLSISTVPTGHVGVKVRFGAVQDDFLSEGLNMHLPIIETVKKIIGYNEKKKMVTIDGVLDTTASFYNVSVDDIKSTNRIAKTAYARQIAIYLAKELTGESFPSIGEFFNRKHTTIMYSHNKVKTDIATDRKLASEINELTNIINE